MHPDLGRLDATLPDLGCGLTWPAVHKTRPRVPLHCPECGHGVHAKVSSRKLRYFAHDRGRPDDCLWDNESFEHHMLKLELANAIRDVGWHAEMEVRAADGSWRADVLASAHDGTRRVAWEAQLATITDDDIAYRTDRYYDDEIDVCWVSTGRMPWIDTVPAIKVREPSEPGQPWTVVDGIARFSRDDGAWIMVTDQSLVAFVGWMLREQTTIHRIRPRYRHVWRAADQIYVRRTQIWTSDRSVDDEAVHDAMRERQKEWKRKKEAADRAAEERRKAAAAARAEEERREREAREAEERAERERRWQEQQREWARRAEEQRLAREAEEQRRQAEAEAVKQKLIQQTRLELQANRRWQEQISAAQLQELKDTVFNHLWRNERARVNFGDPADTFRTGGGIPIHHNNRLHAVLRPNPASLHRLLPDVLVFARNAREAQQLIAVGTIKPDRVIHFDLPDTEQLTLDGLF